ncbi:hypothetical protein [Psychromonas sp. MME2]|uniref:hypothetical protein n=1 Tax=unclassified Psychromonas TaxID=2614957 RepID=UPI00339C8860
MSANEKKLAPMIAIVGCDGSGKSTVVEQALVWAQSYGPAASAHLGKQGGNLGRALNNLPLIGKWIERVQESKAVKVHKAYDADKTPEFLPSLVIYLLTLRRLRRYHRMMKLRSKGLIIITDRYPQNEYTKAIDGPGLSITAKGSSIVRWLAKQEHKAFQWMTSYTPDLVIRLNVDLDTACARKPDHKRDSLEKKIKVVPQLTFNGAPIAEIDTVQPLEDVLAEVREVISQSLTERGYDKHTC